jgi:hypothetical protein
MMARAAGIPSMFNFTNMLPELVLSSERFDLTLTSWERAGIGTIPRVGCFFMSAEVCLVSKGFSVSTSWLIANKWLIMYIF